MAALTDRSSPLGPASDRSAVIVRSRLPGGLERLRRKWVQNAADGVPAHVTLLYPFVEPPRLGPDVRRLIAAVAAAHDPFDYRLVEPGRWPGVVHVRVEPVAPFARLQADLARRFPAFPIYGEEAAFDFVPHVTVAEGPAADGHQLDADRGWTRLPRAGRASAIEIIVRDGGGRWRARWRIGLGRRGRSGPR